jgi:uncharacterized protein
MKPLDFGGGGINGSVDAYGRIIALNFYHPEYGYVTLTSADPFPEDQRYNPQAVRAYRKSLAALEGFGVQWDETADLQYLPFTPHSMPQLKVSSKYGTIYCDEGGIIQRWHYFNQDDKSYQWGGTFSLQRCAYTQLTEGGPVPIPPIVTHLTFSDGILTIENPLLNRVIAVLGLPEGESVDLYHEGVVKFHVPIVKPVDDYFITVYGIGSTRDEAIYHAHRLLQRTGEADLLEKNRKYLDMWQGTFHFPSLGRGLVYSYNMAVPVGEGSCLLTDHMLLPLSWNRDAYYLARALLSWHDDVKDVVRRHLIWMFQIAERTADGAWARCYMANGKIKDGAFQLDQQLFPLLELAEYVLETGDQATFEQLKPYVTLIIEGLLQRKASHAALFPTDETPADDPITLPYHLSSHILFWVVLNKLKRLGMEWGTLQDDLKAAVEEYFVTESEGYAYATDGSGRHHLYHDANDFPTVLAPIWGFCSANDPTWRKTIDFAFSERNTEGMYQGRLGSVHTRAPWALGDVQEMIVAQLLQDSEREDRAYRYLQLASQADGALPEAYDAETGEVVSRHWFAWPNAAYACVMLNAFKD